MTPGAPFGPFSEALGSGLLGGTAGEKNYFIVSYKDEFKNPTTNMNYLRISCVLKFMDVLSKDSPLFSTVIENLELEFFKLSYNVTRAGTYIMDVYVQITESSRLVNGSLGKNGDPAFYVLLHFYYIIILKSYHYCIMSTFIFTMTLLDISIYLLYLSEEHSLVPIWGSPFLINISPGLPWAGNTLYQVCIIHVKYSVK